MQSINHKGESWQTLIATWLGTFFDGMDASIFVLVLFPTLSELLHTKSHSIIAWHGALILATFMIGWTVGSAIFGMIADRFGRVRTMIFTILLYAVCTALCATSHNWMELAFYRFFVGCGIGGEVSVGAVLLAEAWKGSSRYWATGILCSSFGAGYLFTALLNYGIGSFGWRWLYLAGALPALLTIYIRLKLKDSPCFLENQTNMVSKQKSCLTKFSILFDQEHRQRTVCVIGLAAATIVGYWAILSWIPAWINQLVGSSTAVNERSTAAVILNIGSIASSLIFGLLYERIGRVNSFRLAFGGALISCLAMFTSVTTYGPLLLFWAFMVGFFAAAPFVSLFIYVPELYDTQIRSTAFGTSVQSGRIFAAIASLAAGQLISAMGGSYAVAGATVSTVYLVGFLATAFMPLNIRTLEQPKKLSLETAPSAAS
ncbi:MAG: MFS transporter [Candidatus Obscuribacterales bacterium]|nr:MFS transporter [Candidatus Obscuribacterales bacterium]